MNKEYWQARIADAKRRQGKWLGRYRRAVTAGDADQINLTLECVRRWAAYTHYYTIRLKEVAAN